MSDDLVEWLRAQFDADQKKARALSRWPVSAIATELRESATIMQLDMALGYRALAEHVANWDPSRVLREVEAKRKRVDLFAEWRDQPPGVKLHHLDPGWVNISTEEAVLYGIAAQLLKIEALPYSDRPGYREEWRPA